MDTNLREVVISTSANDEFRGMNDLENIGFSDKALIRFGLFIAEMAGADDVIFEKNFSDGKVNVFKVDVDRNVKCNIQRDDDSFIDCLKDS